MYSIYHLLRDLVLKKEILSEIGNLENFPFDKELLSCRNKGIFPDIAIRLNAEGGDLRGRELVEIKDSRSYSIASFNSTIPTARKSIKEVAPHNNSTIYKQMMMRGDDVFAWDIRDVFYLVRGKNKQHTKVCLVHGSFFETIKARDNLRASFGMVLKEASTRKDHALSQEELDRLAFCPHRIFLVAPAKWVKRRFRYVFG